MKAIDLTKVYENYKGLWVALKDGQSNKVVATAKTLKGAVKEAATKGYPQATMMYVPKRDFILIPTPYFIK